MKKIYLLLSIILLAFAFTASSCSDSGKETPEIPTPPGPEPGPDPDPNEEYPYSSLTPEEQKEKLATDASKLLGKLSDLKNEKAISLIETLTAIELPYFENAPSARSIIEINQFHGKYTWNAEEEDWVKSDFADKLILVFPATEKSDSNNGIIEITGEASDSDLNGYRLPKKLNAKLFVDNKNVGTINVEAANISTSTYFKTAKISIDLTAYSIVVDAEKGETNKATLSFKKGSETLIDASFSINGALTEDVLLLGESESVINLMDNLSFIESGDIQKYLNKIDVLKNNPSISDEDYWNGMAQAWNDEITGVLVSKKDETKIASLLYRVHKETYTYGENTYTDFYLVETLKFNDKTSVDAEVFFGQGFDNIKKQWESFINSFYKN